MARLTEEMVIARSKQSDLSAIKKLNCWGAELGDVSLLRRMPNVEVLALSINKIRTLDDFAGCRRLRELYIRKNEIRDLHEIRHLRRLPDLTSLWLEENPCTQHPEYRMTVLRNLPNLEKLDNVVVHPEEVQEAMRRGAHIPDSDDEGYPQQQESYGQYRSGRTRSCDSSPEREPEQFYSRPHQRIDQGSDSSEAGAEPSPDAPPAPQQCPASPPRRAAPPSPDSDERYEHPAMTRSHYEPRPGPRSPDGSSLRHSFSTHSVKEYSYSNGECRYIGGEGRGAGGAGGVASPPHQYHDPYYEKPERSESYQQVPQRSSEVWEQDRASARERDREYPSAVMAEHRGFTRRPVARNSNLLSAVLCLVKELDYPSLEVAEMAVSADNMSPSSSGSWASGPGDIIDLDRYMRGNVRPSRALSDDTNERLVVDGGGCKPRSVASGDSRFKRASLDSGVSDGSYRRRRRTHTKPRRNYQEDANFYPSHDKALTKSVSDRVNSSHSMRAFRTVCEQALLDQQQQIARVAQLCERLTERAERSEAERNMQCVVPDRNKQSGLPERNKQSGCLSPQNERKELPQKTEQKKMRYRKFSAESSEISSSSRSSKDLKRKNEQAKDTYRTQECKTYKIIMTKLDELNRLFATRPPRVPRPSRPPRSASSSSVSVCDKLISTDPQRTYNRVLAPSQRYRNINGPKTSVTSALRSQYNSARTVTQVFAVDIAPRDQEKRTNVLTESIVKCESSGISSRQSVGDPRCGFDLDDPVHLYSQSKRLQSPATRSRRTRSEEPSPVDPWSEQVGEQRRSPSLCAVCRGYWRYLRRCVPVLAKMFDANKC